MGIDKRILRAFEAVLSPEAVGTLRMDSSMGDVKDWNSRTYIEIMLGIEVEFGLELSTLEAARMSSIQGIYKVLAEKGVLLEQ